MLLRPGLEGREVEGFHNLLEGAERHRHALVHAQHLPFVFRTPGIVLLIVFLVEVRRRAGTVEAGQGLAGRAGGGGDPL